jgi:NAD-dependent protein deacetylase/lipoamidase
MTGSIQQAAAALVACRSAVALTGAGISVESGIPPFRGPGGLWEKIDPMRYAHIDAFRQDPAAVWRVLFMTLKQVVEKARPNAGHMGLRHLEQMGILKTIITQNIDGLHQLAGSSDVIEFHGTFTTHSCLACGRVLDSRQVSLDLLPPCCACGGLLRPDVVMFGEMITTDHLQRAQMLAATCDAMLVVGTSATVQPAAYLPVIAKRSGAAIVEINAERTSLTGTISDVTLLGRAGQIMQELVAATNRLLTKH